MTFSVPNFYKAFNAAPRPAADEITIHGYYECDEVRDDFSEYSVNNVPDAVMEYNQDCITMLTPKAFRYYLPRFIKYTCDYPHGNATDYLLYNLSPDDPDSEFWSGRCDEFTSSECGAIISYLEHRKTWPDAETDWDHIVIGLNFWNRE